MTRNLTEEEWIQYVGGEPLRKTCEGLPLGPRAVSKAISYPLTSGDEP